MTRFEARVRDLVRQLDAEGRFRYLLARIELRKYVPLNRPRKDGAEGGKNHE